MLSRQWDTAAATRIGDPRQIGTATITTGLLAAIKATKCAGTRQQAGEQPVNFLQHDRLTVIA